MSQQCPLGLHVALHSLLAGFLLSSCSDEQQQARIVRDQNFIVYEKKSELPACAGSLVGKVVFIEETRETMRCDASGFTVISGELASQSGPGGDPSDQPSDTPPERNTLSVQGRVMASLYDDSDTTGAGEPLTPVAGLPVYVWIDGTKLVSLTDTDGYYRFSGVPAVPSANDSAENSVVIHFDPVTSGYVIAPNLTSSTQQTVLAEISVAANQDFPEQMKYQVDAGVSRVFEYGLYFDPGLGRVAAPDGNDWDVGSSGRWLQGAPGATSTFYLANAANSIPISFTLPVDRDYAGTDFVHLLDPDGKLVPSTGTWNDQGTLFTLDPQSDLVGSENDESGLPKSAALRRHGRFRIWPRVSSHFFDKARLDTAFRMTEVFRFPLCEPFMRTSFECLSHDVLGESPAEERCCKGEGAELRCWQPLDDHFHKAV